MDWLQGWGIEVISEPEPKISETEKIRSMSKEVWSALMILHAHGGDN